MGVGAGLYMYDVVVKTFTFAISSIDEFLYRSCTRAIRCGCTDGVKFGVYTPQCQISFHR